MPTNTKTSITRVKCWQGYCHNPDIALTEHDILNIHRLLQGDYKNLRYKQLKSVPNIQSIRCSHERRLILTNVDVETEEGTKPKLYLKVIGIAATHNYAEIIRSYLNGNDADKPLTFISIDDIEALEIDNGDSIAIIPSNQPLKLTRYNHRLLVLNADQTAATQLTLPALITGPAGSGKTLSMLTHLNTLIEDLIQNNITIDKPIAVVTPKPELNKILYNLWYCENNILSTTQVGSHVVFLSEAEIYLQHAPALTNGFTIIASDDFTILIRTTLTKKAKNKFKNCTTLDNLSLLHEFEIMANAGSAQTYLNLGERESYLSGESSHADRTFLYHCFEQVSAALQKQKKISPYIYRWNPAVLFHAVLHDEAQAGLLNVKLILKQMADQARYLLCAHSAQTTNKKLTDLPRFIQQLGVDDQPLTVHTLTISYRNPLLVLLFSDYINRLKRYVAGGAPDKTDVVNAVAAKTNATNRGTLAWCSLSAVPDYLTQQPANNTDTVVITHKAFIPEAIALFGTGHVLTAPQFGGQECDTVIAYKLTHHQDGEGASANLENFTDDTKDNINLPKSGQSHFEFNPFFAELYTACTRAKQAVIFVEDETPAIQHKRRFLIQHLKNKITALNTQHPAENIATHSTEPKTPETTEREWLEKIEAYLAKNEIDVARQLWVVNLKRKTEDFDITYLNKSAIKPTVATAPKQIPAPRTKKAPPKAGAVVRIDLENIPAIYQQLDADPTFIKVLCQELNGKIPLSEILTKCPDEFLAYFEKHPKILTLLSANDWLRRGSKSSYHLLLLVTLYLCKTTMPRFMSHTVYAANNYQLLADISIEEMFHQQFPSPKHPTRYISLIEFILSSCANSNTQVTLIHYYLTKHKNDAAFIALDTIVFLHYIMFEIPAHAKLAQFKNFNPERDAVALIRQTFLNTAYTTYLNHVLRPAPQVTILEYILTNPTFAKAITEYYSNPEREQRDPKVHQLVVSRLHECFTKVKFTRMVTLMGITAPFIFHLLDCKESRLLLAHVYNKLQSALFLRTRAENALFVTQLLTKYPSVTFSSGDTLAEATCFDILRSDQNHFSGICTLVKLFHFSDYFKQCLESNSDLFFFDTDAATMPTFIGHSLLFYIYSCYDPTFNTTGLHLLITLEKGLLLKYAPNDFILRIADKAPERLFGHLLIQDHSFDFVEHYYEAIKEHTSAQSFANILYQFLFETDMLALCGYITTFTALRDIPQHHSMLRSALAFIKAHSTVLQEIDTSFPELPPIEDLGEYDPINKEQLFQVLSINQMRKILADILPQDLSRLFKRRDLLTLFFYTLDTNRGKSIFLVKQLLENPEVAKKLYAFLKEHPALLRHIFNVLQPMERTSLHNRPTYFEVFVTDEHLLTLLELAITTDPLYFFVIKQHITHDFLLSTMSTTMCLQLFGLARYAPNLLKTVTINMPHTITSFLPSVWLPVDDHENAGSIMLEILTQSISNQLTFADILRMQDYHLLRQLSLKQLLAPHFEVHTHPLLQSKQYGILDFALATLTYKHDKLFHEFIFALLFNSLEKSNLILALSQPNYSNNFYLGQPQLFYFCYQPYFVSRLNSVFESLSLEDMDKFFQTLCYSSPYMKEDANRSVWSALSVLIIKLKDEGIVALNALFSAYPHFIDKIPLEAWSSPDNKENYVLLNLLRHNTVKPNFYQFLYDHSENVRTADVKLKQDDAVHHLLTQADPNLSGYAGSLFNPPQTPSMYDMFKFERTKQQP